MEVRINAKRAMSYPAFMKLTTSERAEQASYWLTRDKNLCPVAVMLKLPTGEELPNCKYINSKADILST